VLTGDGRDLFVAIATCAATLIGLLFVAQSVANDEHRTHPVVRHFRAAAALLAFVNAFTVTLFGLVPGSNIGGAAVVVGVIGLFFTAAGLRVTVSLPRTQQRRRHQLPLILGLLAVFGLQIFFGIELLAHRPGTGAVSGLGDVLIVSLLIGIARAWELVGEWDTGIAASIGVLFGRRPPGWPSTDDGAEDDDEAGPG